MYMNCMTLDKDPISCTQFIYLLNEKNHRSPHPHHPVCCVDSHELIFMCAYSSV